MSTKEMSEAGSRKPHNSESDVIVNENTSLASVIIEELDETAINSMEMNMAEFIEAEAFEVQFEDDAVTDSSIKPQDHDALLPPEEEERLTKQFLNGELTFSEYSSRMDQDADLETADPEFVRKDNESEALSTQKINNRKIQKLSGSGQTCHRRKKRTLPPALQGLMGEANLRFAKGETQLAAQMCMEIIRQVPSAPEPFHTLAMIYETDQPEKSLQFALIAAHLSPKDADQWVRLANLSVESGNIKQAITCYSKAIQANPKDIHLYDIRAQLQDQNGDKKGTVKGYAKLLHQLEPEDGESIIKYAKLLAKRYIQENNSEQALQAMENIFVKCSHLITLEEVNLMTELLITTKQFTRCLDILTKYTTIWVRYKSPKSSDIQQKETVCENESSTEMKESENSEAKSLECTTDNNIREIESCGIPDDVVVDLKAKFLIALIELNEIEMADKLLPKLYLEENPEVSGDLFLDVAESLMGKNEFKRALILLDPLVESKNFSLAAVWLRHAECWVACNDLNKAIRSYEMIRELSSQHLGARVALAKLYQRVGQHNKVIEVLEQDPESDTLDPGVIYQRTLLLFKAKRYNDYFRSAMLLLSRHCVTIRSKEELSALTRACSVRQRLEVLQLHRLSCGEKLEDENAPMFLDNTEPSEKDEFLLFLQMCKLACKLKKYGLLQRICFSALTSKRFQKRNSHIMFLCLLSCIYNNDSYYGYNIVRELVRMYNRSNCWNLLNIVIQRTEDLRHNRFIMRLLRREDVFSRVHMMQANNCLVSGTYKYALNDYVSLFRVDPNALLALLVAITMLQMACQKLSAKKNQLVIQVIAFLKKYAELRGAGGQQETNYNMGRAFHQLGLLPAAVHFYKRVLDTESEEIVSRHAKLLDLNGEAAFNLHLIYLHSENPLLARMYLEKYITV